VITGGIKGRAEIRHVQGILTASPAKMHKNLAAGVRKELKPLKPDIQAMALKRMPSGYGGTLAGAVRVQTNVTTAGNRIKARVEVSAKGKKEQRDVAAKDLGILRHPLFGSRKEGHWFDQRVRPRFVSDPVDDAQDRIVDMAREARDDVADDIVRG
jgi:hypothetical protein